MLLNVAAHNLSIRNVKVSKSEHHIMYSITKRTASQNVKCTLRNHYKTFCNCAAKAFYSCPAIISRRPESQDTSKEPQLNTQEESKRIQARSHITLEKSSRNYKPYEE